MLLFCRNGWTAFVLLEPQRMATKSYYTLPQNGGTAILQHRHPAIDILIIMFMAMSTGRVMRLTVGYVDNSLTILCLAPVPYHKFKLSVRTRTEAGSKEAEAT